MTAEDCPSLRRARGERRRRPRGRSAERSTRSARCPGVRLRGSRRLYATAPVGVTDQPDFRNAVVALDVPAGPDPAVGATELLAALKGLERDVRTPASAALGSARARPRPARLRPSTACDRPSARGPVGRRRDRSGEGRAAARGPASGRRGAAVRPCAARRPRAGLVPPGWHETVETRRLERAAGEGPDAVRPIARWDADRRRWLWIQPTTRV